MVTNCISIITGEPGPQGPPGESSYFLNVALISRIFTKRFYDNIVRWLSLCLSVSVCLCLSVCLSVCLSLSSFKVFSQPCIFEQNYTHQCSEIYKSVKGCKGSNHHTHKVALIVLCFVALPQSLYPPAQPTL